MNRLYNSIEVQGGFQLSDHDKKYVKTRLSTIDFKRLSKYDSRQIYETTVNLMVKELQKKRNKREMFKVKPDIVNNKEGMNAGSHVNQKSPLTEEYDMHLYLSEEIKDKSLAEQNVENIDNQGLIKPLSTEIEIASILGLNDAFSIQQLFNPDALLIRNYAIYDSKNRILLDNPVNQITLFTWSYADTADIRDGTINSVGRIRDLKEIRIYQPRVPFIYNGTPNMNSETRRVAILIPEFQAQSFIGPQGSRFHFLLQPVIPLGPPPEMIELKVEEFNEGKFSFRKPITTFDTLSLQFLDPVNVIPFLHDRDNIVLFTYGNPTIITVLLPHLFTNAVTYGTISGFTTADPSADAAQIAYINSPREIPLTITGANTFSLAVDTSTITPAPDLNCTIFYDERRIVLPVQFTYLRSDK